MFDISLHLNGILDLIKQFSMQNIDFIICKLLQKYLHSFKKIKFNATFIHTLPIMICEISIHMYWNNSIIKK